MKKSILMLSICLLSLTGYSQISKGQVGAVLNAAKAFTVSDAEILQYTKESVKWMDENNPVCLLNDKNPEKKAYAKRLDNIFKPYKNYDGLDLNYKVYYVTDVNAFATYDGSIRVMAGIMDIMTDDELLGIIGHEIGHVKLGHTKKGYQKAILTSALADYAKATDGVVGQLTNSELGDLAVAMTGAQFSKGQESDSDSYAYDFMVKNGKDPMALATAFQKFADLSKSEKSSTIDKLMSSHPDSAKRADRVIKKIEKEQKRIEKENKKK